MGSSGQSPLTASVLCVQYPGHWRRQNVDSWLFNLQLIQLFLTVHFWLDVNVLSRNKSVFLLHRCTKFMDSALQHIGLSLHWHWRLSLAVDDNVMV